ncbi:MAG: hypothetical protein QNJ54_07045 [Prochloraceae cyanobacterium]|nr:hypothetical protein [Prochloraceae cyanobacterium]
MLRWAVGRPDRGNELPYFQGNPVDISNLKNFDKEEPKDSEAERKNYILKEIFFATIEDFKYCFEIHDREKKKGSLDVKEPTELEWEKVYKIIEKADKKKITWERRNTLKSEREQSGFESMMELALGHPNPGDPLPKMPNNYTKLIDIFKNITQEPVVRYIKEELYLSLEDFRKIMEIQAPTENPKEQKWEEVYRLVEKAQTKKRNFTYPPIGRTEIKNIHASSIVDEKEGQATISQRFPTFGNITTSQNYSIGFAIASPILFLKEGRRNITITLSCQEATLNANSINQLIDREKIPFEIYLSSEKEWIKVESSVFAVGDFIVEQELKSYDNPLSLDPSSLICTSEADTFEESDRDRYLVFKDGKIYQIAQYISPTQVQLSPVGQLSSSHDTVKQYSVSGIYFNSLQFKLTLGDEVSAIAPLKSNQSSSNIAISSPAVKFYLKPEENKAKEKVIYYEQFKSIRLAKIKIQVNTKNTVNDSSLLSIQDIQIRNDSSVLNAKSTFQPFGNNPKVGSGFYFFNTEICQKKLDSLVIKMEWMGLPQDFGEHYKAYSDAEVIKAIANNSFKASLRLLNNRSWVDIESPKSIFIQKDNTLSNAIQLNYQNFNISGYSLDTSTVETDTDDPVEQNRYFKLELESPDFAHDLYPVVLNKVALSTDDAIKSLTVYPPYTPEVKAISLDYTASVEIDLQASQSD